MHEPYPEGKIQSISTSSYLAMKNLVFVPHIQKTGLGKYYRGLIGHYGRDNVLLVGSTQTGCNVEATEFRRLNCLDRYSLIIGHITVSEALANPIFLQLASNKKVRVVSIVRDPIDRLVSLYNFIRRWPMHPRHCQLQSVELNEFLLGFPSNIQSLFLDVNLRNGIFKLNNDSIVSMHIFPIEDSSHKAFELMTGSRYTDDGFLNSSRDSELSRHNPARLRLDIPYAPRTSIRQDVLSEMSHRNSLDLLLYEFSKKSNSLGILIS